MTENNSGPPKGFTKRESEFGVTWEPNIGDTLQGIIIALKHGVKTRTQRGSSDILIVRDGDGALWSVWISAGLAGTFSDADVAHEVWLKRTEDAPPRMRGRNPMKQFDVAVN